jgi:hypothetical protein
VTQASRRAFRAQRPLDEGFSDVGAGLTGRDVDLAEVESLGPKSGLERDRLEVGPPSFETAETNIGLET